MKSLHHHYQLNGLNAKDSL